MYTDFYREQGAEPRSSAKTPSITRNKARIQTPLFLYLAAKRTVDIVGSLIGLLLLLPVFAAVAWVIRRDSLGSIFHRRRVLEQQTVRPDRSLRTFDAFKFRTMIENADAYLQKHPELLQEYTKDFKLKQDPRVTRVGKILRTTSVDELPQLLNVLRGQMTLVGPRMIIPAELDHYGECGVKLLSVKPGMTGLWQVSGRQHISYRERVRLDMEYIENRGLLLDFQILLRTIICVLKREGAY